MIYDIIKWFLFISLLAACSHPLDQNSLYRFEQDRNRAFNDDWRFFPDSIPGAEQPEFNDSEWQTVELPHDWSVENRIPCANNEKIGIFSRESPGGASTGHVQGGSAWYRKTFVIDSSDQGKIFNLKFDGVYMLADVWVNGKKAGSHYYGYTPFSFNITLLLKSNAKNIVAVRVRNLGENSRWYSGSGIYRQVNLQVTEPVYMSDQDVFISTSSADNEKADLDLLLKIRNESIKEPDVSIQIILEDQNGRNVYDKKMVQKLAAGITSLPSQSIEIKTPDLWSLSDPVLYKLIIKIYSRTSIYDIFSIPIGIRTISFSAEKGFLLNGSSLKIRGACVHSDNGILGAVTIGRAEERKIELLKKNGFNAIRTSHNPPSKLFLEYCDKLGMLVLDEAFDMWEYPKNPQDYHLYFKDNWKSDIESMVYRDRNHPSVIIWSIGNEIYERADTSGVRIAKQLSETIRQLDPTRPLIAGITDYYAKPRNTDWSGSEPAFKYLDIGGYNYLTKYYETDHEKYPDRIILGTESFAIESFENWLIAESNPCVIGDFVWTGIDYIGESGIAHNSYGGKINGLLPWPCYNSWCGDLDLTGEKKPQSYYRDVVWSRSKLEMAVHKPLHDGKKEFISAWGFPEELQSWTWPGSEGKDLQVTVYSRCQSVILKLNGKVIGQEAVSEATKLKATFNVPYTPGKLEAIGMDNGNVTATKILTTTGPPARLGFSADRDELSTDRNDLSYITVSILDEQGRLVINNDLKIKLSVTGEGVLIASGNGAPDDMESFRNPEPKTFQGRCLAIVRPSRKSGIIKLTAETSSLPPVTLTLKSK